MVATGTVASLSTGFKKLVPTTYKANAATATALSATGTCASGEITFSGTARGFASQAGGFILDMGTGLDGIAALKQSSITATTVTSNVGERSTAIMVSL